MLINVILQELCPHLNCYEMTRMIFFLVTRKCSFSMIRSSTSSSDWHHLGLTGTPAVDPVDVLASTGSTDCLH